MYSVTFNNTTLYIAFTQHNILNVFDANGEPSDKLNGCVLYGILIDGRVYCHSTIRSGVTRMFNWKKGIIISNGKGTRYHVKSESCIEFKKKRRFLPW